MVIISSYFMCSSSAVSLLADAQPGSFVVRNSTSSPGAFALAIRVAQLPPNKASKGKHFISSTAEYIVMID